MRSRILFILSISTASGCASTKKLQLGPLSFFSKMSPTVMAETLSFARRQTLTAKINETTDALPKKNEDDRLHRRLPVESETSTVYYFKLKPPIKFNQSS